MPVKLTIEKSETDKVGQIIKALGGKMRQQVQRTNKVVYTADYAVHVHENLEMRHPNGGQAKYLEEPAIEMADELGKLVADLVASGMTLTKATYTAATRLLAASQKLVPVDTGHLHGSGQVVTE